MAMRVAAATSHNARRAPIPERDMSSFMLLSFTSTRGAAGVPPEPHWGLLPLALILLVLGVLVDLDVHLLAAAISANLGIFP